MSTPALPWFFVETCCLPANSVRLDEAVRPGLEYQMARTATHVQPGATLEITEPGEPPSATALRVAAALTGLWADQDAPGCQPDLGEHLPHCRHREAWMTVTFREVAREAFGDDGGSQVQQVKAALRELMDKATRVMIFDRKTKRLIGESHGAGSYLWLGGVLRWQWNVYTLTGLLGGGYQRLPAPIVQELSGSAFHVWREVICSPSTAALKPGQSHELAVTGRSSSLQLQRLGLDKKNRPAKVRAALDVIHE